MTKILALSDTHELHHQFINLPPADIFIFAGDFSNYGKLNKIRDFNDWLDSLNYEYKIIIAGNHDIIMQDNKRKYKFKNCIYLEDSMINVKGLNIYGSPYSNKFGNWAFMESEPDLKNRWKKIPTNVDILITHGPPYGIMDYVPHSNSYVGSKSLLDTINSIKPKFHVFGHIHENPGTIYKYNTTFINASFKPTTFSL